MMRALGVTCAATALLSASISGEGAAPPCRYTIYADTVRDNTAALLWQRTVPAQTYTWADAERYCQGLSLGGLTSGWRLPTAKELASLVDERAGNPAIDQTTFPDTPSNFFWSSSPYVGLESNAWGVHFSDGHSDFSNRSFSYRVRCVR